jgi:hypothetical protein
VPARIAAFRGVVETGIGARVTGTERIDGTGVRAPASGQGGADCMAWDGPLDSLGVGSLVPLAGVSFPRGAPALGLLGPDTMLARVSVQVDGTGTPAPVRGASGCVAGLPWNWGDPRVEAGRCGRLRVVRAASGDLVVDGGVGQGLVVVGGDLTLQNGADLRGVVLVGGTLSLEGGARLEGLVRAAGGVALSPDSHIVGSACWAALALDAAREVVGAPILNPGAEPALALPPG